MNRTALYIVIFVLVLILIIYVTKQFMKQLLLKPVNGTITTPFGPRVAPIAGASTFHNGVDIAILLTGMEGLQCGSVGAARKCFDVFLRDLAAGSIKVIVR